MSEVLERPRTKKLTLGATIDSLWGLREKKRTLTAELKTVDADIALMETDLLAIMAEQDTRRGEGKLASVGINYAVNPTTKDWDATAKWIITGKRGDRFAYQHLLYKRIAAPAYRELRALGVVIPGQEDFTNTTITLSTLKPKL